MIMHFLCFIPWPKPEIITNDMVLEEDSKKKHGVLSFNHMQPGIFQSANVLHSLPSVKSGINKTLGNGMLWLTEFGGH